MQEEQFSKLSEKIRGSLITPASGEYEVARKVYNEMIDRRPAAIVRCADVTDVRAAVNFARQDGSKITIRGGCHSGVDDRCLGRPFMNPAARCWLFIMPQDWTWWVWLVMACLLLIGLIGMPEAFLAALLLSIAQSVLFFARERAFTAFPFQLRLAYTLLLIICLFPPIR